MDEIKTLPFDWEFGQEEVALVVSSYADNGSLYVGLYCKEEDGTNPSVAVIISRHKASHLFANASALLL